MNNYVKQLKDFQSYLNSCFDVLMYHGDNESVDMFYKSDFEITFRGKTVTIANGAEVFQAIEEIIATELEECEEES